MYALTTIKFPTKHQHRSNYLHHKIYDQLHETLELGTRPNCRLELPRKLLSTEDVSSMGDYTESHPPLCNS